MKGENILNNIFTYCDRATIGVLKYITRRSLSKFERVFWIICIVLTIISSVWLINESVNKFLARKITIKISDERFEVGYVPFPAISICPEVIMSEIDFSTVFQHQSVSYDDVIYEMALGESKNSSNEFVDKLKKISQIEWFSKYGGKINV